jgi:hypothetical protein
MKILYLLSGIVLSMGNIIFLLFFPKLKAVLLVPIILSFLVGIGFAYVLYCYFHSENWQRLYSYETSKGQYPVTSIGLWLLHIWPQLPTGGHMPKNVKKSARLIYGYTFRISLIGFLLTAMSIYFINKPETVLLMIYAFFINIIGLHFGINSYFLNVFVKNLKK